MLWFQGQSEMLSTAPGVMISLQHNQLGSNPMVLLQAARWQHYVARQLVVKLMSAIHRVW
jgi:hypothetical protein